jgi:hypothetical protein
VQHSLNSLHRGGSSANLLRKQDWQSSWHFLLPIKEEEEDDDNAHSLKRCKSTAAAVAAAPHHFTETISHNNPAGKSYDYGFTYLTAIDDTKLKQFSWHLGCATHLNLLPLWSHVTDCGCLIKISCKYFESILHSSHNL